MSETNNEIILCGQGRMGQGLSQLLDNEKIDYDYARLDVEKGLISKSNLSNPINLLVIAMANGQRGDRQPPWYWHEIYQGLIRQVINRELSIKNVVMVSSTRVYDAIQSGIVTAETQASAMSEKGKQIITAEKQLLDSSMSSRVLRCSGIYGEGYEKYKPIMLAAKDRCYFGVDLESIIQRLFYWVKQSLSNNFTQGIELLTDEQVYFQQKQFDFEQDEERIVQLSESYRVLKNSDIKM